MEVRFLTAQVAEQHAVEDLPKLLDREDGFVWVDVPVFDDAAERVLSQMFGCRSTALRLCAERNHIPQVHVYPEHVLLILHTPEAGEAGHIHLLEIDQFVGHRYLITVHGPLNPAVPPQAALVETDAVWERVRSGKFQPGSPFELSYAIGTAIARRQQTFVTTLARTVADLEQRVMVSTFRHPELLLEEMFLIRHELLVVRTMAAQSHEIYARMGALSRFMPDDAVWFVTDLGDQFERVRSMSDGEKEFLFGVIDFYQSRISTKMTIASERLALLAVMTLPITAIASIYGMNFEHMPELKLWFWYPLVIVTMLTISGVLLRWARRQGWW